MFLANALPSHCTVFLYQGEKLNLFKHKHAVFFDEGHSFPFLKTGEYICVYVAVVISAECHS